MSNNKGLFPIFSFHQKSYLRGYVCLPTWEGILESWGSSIEHLFKIKPNTKEGLELGNNGTVDKLAFIRLNGPPTGLSL